MAVNTIARDKRKASHSRIRELGDQETVSLILKIFFDVFLMQKELNA